MGLGGLNVPTPGPVYSALFVQKEAKTRFHSFSHQVKVARGLHLKVRVVGSTHSWSNLYPDPGQILLSMENFKMLPDKGLPAEMDTVS